MSKPKFSKLIKWCVEKYSVQAVAMEFGVSSWKVAQWIKNRNLPPRAAQKSIIGQLMRNQYIKENFRRKRIVKSSDKAA